MDEREFNLAREIESALSISSMLNMHERPSTVAYLLQNYKKQIQQEQCKVCAAVITERVKPIELHPDVIAACLNAYKK